jgi:hypothetical protein
MLQKLFFSEVVAKIQKLVTYLTIIIVVTQAIGRVPFVYTDYTLLFCPFFTDTYR